MSSKIMVFNTFKILNFLKFHIFYVFKNYGV
jgi:hypothetical protein